jgi:threonine dehydratase
MDITHHRMFIDLPVKRAEVDVLVETRNANHVAEVIEKLEQAGFSTRRLSSRSGEG